MAIGVGDDAFHESPDRSRSEYKSFTTRADELWTVY